MEREIDMLCKLIEVSCPFRWGLYPIFGANIGFLQESQREASTLLSYAGKVTSSNKVPLSSNKKWSPAYQKDRDTRMGDSSSSDVSPWGPPLPPSVGYSSSGELWRPTSVVSLDVKSFLSPII